MRFVTRTLGFVILILAAFWFTAENAGQRVVIDFAFFRLRASVPLVVFGSILFGMSASVFMGWRAVRASRGHRDPPSRLGSTDPGFDYGEDLDLDERAPVERSPLG